MHGGMRKKFRIVYLIGLLLLFTSLFLEWYIFQAYDSSKKLVAYWSYNPITGWSTMLSEGSTLNYALKPHAFHMPIAITGLYIIMLFVSAYTVLFKDVEQEEEIQKLNPYAYANLFLLMLILFFVVVFPVFYLIPNDLYFPFLYVKDKDLDVVYHYWIGPGYAIQVIGFIMVFPYAMFYYNTVLKFKSKESSAKDFVERYLQSVQERLDLDKMIANEQLKVKYDDVSFERFEDLEIPHNKPKKKRRRV